MSRRPQTIEQPPAEPPLGFGSPNEAMSHLTTVGYGHPIPDLPDDEEIDDVTALNNVLMELGATDSEGGFVSVFKEVVSRSGKREDEFIDKFPVTEFSLTDLKDRFGAGRYKINVYRSGARPGLATRKTITIAETVKPVAIAAPTVAPSSDIANLAQIMVSGFQELGKLIVANKPAEANRSDMLKEMVIMKELFSSNQPQNSQLGVLDALKIGLEMAQSSNGDSNSMWIGKMVDKFGEPLANLMMAGMVQPAPAPRPVARPSAPTPQLPTTPEQPEGEDMNMMKLYMATLNNAAARSEPAAEWADRILSMLNDEQVTEVESILNAVDWRERLAALSSDTAKYPVWYDSLRGFILSYILEDRQAEGLTSPGVSANFNPHAPTNTGNQQPTGGVDLNT